MSTYIAHPIDETQDKAVKAFSDAHQVPYEVKIEVDETTHLLSTEAIQNEAQLKGVKVSLDDIYK